MSILNEHPFSTNGFSLEELASVTHMSYEISSHVKFIADEEGGTLMDVKHDAILSLNETGTLIWEGLKRKDPVNTIAQHLANKYSLEYQQALVDVQEFLLVLKQNLLIHQGS
ncbi:MAG: PqqD family protein [Acidobacteriota bacterium]|nr:PqqD family protein [Acidobacteriota bacterium]